MARRGRLHPRPQHPATYHFGVTTDPPADPPAVPLAENRDFKVVLSSQGASSIGDAVSFTALPLLVLALTGSGLAMGIVGALQALPDLGLGMVAGALADRSDRKRMMLLADLGRAALIALIPISVALDGPTMVVILLVAAPASMLRSFFLAAYTASVPMLVGRSQIGRANSYFEAIYSTGYIVGPAIAGVLASTIGPGPTLAIDAVSFALSALGLLFVHGDLRAPVGRPRQHIVREIRDGIDYIVADPTLRTIVLFFGSASIMTAPLVAALAVHITRDLGQPASILGLILAAYGVGTVLGALLTARWIGSGQIGTMLLGGNLGMGARAGRDGRHHVACGPGRGRAAGRDLAVACPDHLPDSSDGPVARCPAGTDRQHGPHDLTWPPADRPAGRWRLDRPDQRIRGDGRDGRWRDGGQPRVRAGTGHPAGIAAVALTERSSGGRGELKGRIRGDLDENAARVAFGLGAVVGDGHRAVAPGAVDVDHRVVTSLQVSVSPGVSGHVVTATVSRPRARVPKTARQVVVDEPDALHQRIDDGRADEFEAAPLQVGR